VHYVVTEQEKDSVTYLQLCYFVLGMACNTGYLSVKLSHASHMPLT